MSLPFTSSRFMPLFGLLAGLAASAAVSVSAEEADASVFAEPTLSEAAAAPAEPSASKSVDPLEGFNRKVFAFNNFLDRWLVRPVAVVYTTVMPDPLEKGVSNVFRNIYEIPNAFNGALQGNFKNAAHHTGRLLVNTTLGVGGLFDVAQHMKLPSQDREDFGQTLAVWGVGSGPYLMLPFMGPTTLRDGLAMPIDAYTTNPTMYIDHVPTRNTITGLTLLDARAGLLPLEKNLTGDKYTMIRDVYLQRRAYLINNGKIEDNFGAEDDFDMDDFDASF